MIKKEFDHNRCAYITSTGSISSHCYSIEGMLSSSVPLLEFDEQGEITLIQSSKIDELEKKNSPMNNFHLFVDERIPKNNGRCLLFQYILHQLSLIIFITIYLVFGGVFFYYIESRYYLKKDVERKELISETYENIRRLSMQLLNEQLNENFDEAYQRWRWQTTNLSPYVSLNEQRAQLLDNRTKYELETLTIRLAMRQAAMDKYVYKWTYSTAILYAVTLVTTIGYGNIAPKTAVGKISTVICKIFNSDLL